MRRYRAADPNRLRDILLEEVATILDRHAAGLADNLGDVRQEIDAVLLTAERDPYGFHCWKRRVRQARNAETATGAADG